MLVECLNMKRSVLKVETSISANTHPYIMHDVFLQLYCINAFWVAKQNEGRITHCARQLQLHIQY